MKTDIDVHLDQIARAVARRAGGLSVCRVAADGGVPGAVVVSGTAAARGAVVAAAVDDDGIGPAPVIRYAAAQARSLGVPLRVVHVWTERPPTRHGVRASRPGRMSDADRLLATVIYEHLTAGEAEATEREILHDSDVVHALIAVSAEAALLVVAARSTAAAPGEPLGDTVRGLVGRTTCPLAVLAPDAPDPVTRGAR